MTESLEVFHQFFNACVGRWVTERTYHYLTHQDVERSHTEFEIEPLTPITKTKVLEDNQYPQPADLSILPGFHLGFDTVSDKGERVSQQLNMLFIHKSDTSPLLEGDYLRDRAYEEAKPIVSHFTFDSSSRELLMTTTYTRVVSIDSITLINPQLRIRRILNYRRPAEGEPLEELVLVGFGVEQKVS